MSPRQESQRGDKRKKQVAGSYVTDFKWGFPNLHCASTFITPTPKLLLRGFLALFLFLLTTPTVLSILLNTLTVSRANLPSLGVDSIRELGKKVCQEGFIAGCLCGRACGRHQSSFLCRLAGPGDTMVTPALIRGALCHWH